MQTRYSKSVKLWLFIIFIFLALPSQAEVFISIGSPSVEIGGDMDGTSFVGGGGSVELMPEQDDGSGTKFSIGSYSDDISFDFSLVRTDHDGQFLGVPFDSKFQSLNMDVKYSALGSEQLRGLLILGLGFSSVKVKNGSSDGFEVEDAKFSGIDFRFGIGARYRLMDNVAIEVNAVQRYGSYNSVDGVVSGTISDSVDGDGITTSLELIYIFAD